LASSFERRSHLPGSSGVRLSGQKPVIAKCTPRAVAGHAANGAEALSALEPVLGYERARVALGFDGEASKGRRIELLGLTRSLGVFRCRHDVASMPALGRAPP
jgi:hypothetical protein